jgi:hypothetical protein
MRLRCLTLITLIFTLLLQGCSAQWHLQTAVKKDPSILVTKIVTVTDTVVTEPVVIKDTLTLSEVDTVEIIKDKFHLKIMRSYDTLIIDGGCDADTILRTIEVPIETVVYQERDKWYHKVQEASLWVLIVLIIALIVRSKIDKLI